MGTPDNPAIECIHVTKKFRFFRAVDDISLSVQKSEIVGFVGANGAGKTTTINILMGFTSASSGSVRLFGQQIKPAKAHVSHRRVGYAANDMELPDKITGQQYLQFVLRQSKGDFDKKLAHLISIFDPQLHKKMSTLSRGNRQKIALIAAFVTEPDLVLLDEPTSGLDPLMQTAFLDLIRAEKEKGTTVFMSSHNLQEVTEVCTRVVLMKNGQIVKDLTAEQLQEAEGKKVRVIASSQIIPPELYTTNVVQLHTKRGNEMSFGYTGPMHLLQKWMSEVKHISDIEISERTLEAEFRDLYAISEDESE